MNEPQKRLQPKKIKMPPLVDRSQAYDTLSFDSDTLYVELNKNKISNEDHSENNSESIPELESM